MALQFLEAIQDITVKGFDPDEPRNDHGEWTSGGGSDKPRLGRASSYRNPYRMSHGATRAYTPGDELARAKAEQQMREAQQKVDDLQRQLSDHAQDKSEDLYWGLHNQFQQAQSDLAELKAKIVGKAFNPDEPRDAIGRWTSGDSGPDHPDFMDAHDGYSMHEAFDGVTSKMEDSVAAISSAHDALRDAASNQEDVSTEEDDLLDEHGPDSKEYTEWEGRNLKAGQDVADAAMSLRNAVADHLEATAGVLKELDTRIQRSASNDNVRAK